VTAPIGHSWIEAVRQLGGPASAAAAGAAELEKRYAEVHRRYHNAAHAAAVVRDCAWLAGELGLSASSRALVALAACAHDVVYDGKPGDDERASAAWAVGQLSAAGVASGLVRRVSQLVLATITHSARAADQLAAVLLDADLAILGSAPEDYGRYVAAVRQEYDAVSDPDWRVGRARVLTDLLAHDPLFMTAPARARWEAQARHNIEAELRTLVD
jgi:predicted metal-dependent HD superfamily phosphohydrolase